MSVLNEWDSFYVIVGSAAGALIGLQFVVMTLMAEKPQPGILEAGRAFATPTVVHFGATLLLAGLVRVPWPAPAWVTWVTGFMGVCGLAYMAWLARQMRRQRHYTMDLEDITFHVVLPLLAYVLLALSCWLELDVALYGVGASALLLLFVGIHNAWDAVAYQVYVVRSKKNES